MVDKILTQNTTVVLYHYSLNDKILVLTTLVLTSSVVEIEDGWLFGKSKWELSKRGLPKRKFVYLIVKEMKLRSKWRQWYFLTSNLLTRQKCQRYQNRQSEAIHKKRPVSPWAGPSLTSVVCSFDDLDGTYTKTGYIVSDDSLKWHWKKKQATNY